MSGTPWTPGPWRVESNRFGHWGVREVVGSSLGISGFTIATDVDSARAERIEADCRLIAAAPDLYAALERMESHFRILPDEMDAPGCVFAQARAALAKAKGETT